MFCIESRFVLFTTSYVCLDCRERECGGGMVEARMREHLRERHPLLCAKTLKSRRITAAGKVVQVWFGQEQLTTKSPAA
jgi:hypothetical protein